MDFKIGLGYDIHRLEKGKKLFLGGIEIPFSKGLTGHSDGDCLIHAIIDALLGALGEKDIGENYPDSDPRYKGIRSTELLKDVCKKLDLNKMKITNMDTIIIAEKPKMNQYVPAMKKTLCHILGIKENSLGIKAKTSERFGTIGREEAIACWAQVLLEKK